MNIRLKIHPLFVALAVILIFCGRAAAFLWTLLAVSMHEWAHAAVARSRGYSLKELVLLPYGAVLYGVENIDRKSALMMAAAGPLMNLFLIVCLLALWWVAPSVREKTTTFFYANLSLALFNLIPAFPLDGGRVILSFCKNKPRALKALRIIGIAVSLLLFAGFVISLFFEANFAFVIMAVFMFVGAVLGTDKEMYRHVTLKSGKDYITGVEVKTVQIDITAPLIRALKKITENSTVTFEIFKGGRKLGVLSELDMKKLFEAAPLYESIEKSLIKVNDNMGLEINLKEAKKKADENERSFLKEILKGRSVKGQRKSHRRQKRPLFQGVLFAPLPRRRQKRKQDGRRVLQPCDTELRRG